MPADVPDFFEVNLFAHPLLQYRTFPFGGHAYPFGIFYFPKNLFRIRLKGLYFKVLSAYACNRSGLKKAKIG